MKSNKLKSKYHILVVSDQTKTSRTALKNAVNLAKSIDGSIELFHVKPPAEVVRYDNQLSAMRVLNRERLRIEKDMKSMVDQIAENERIPIIYDFSFGNVTNEVIKHINKTQPDIVVLGKAKTKVNNLLGTDLTSYLLRNYKGTLLISSSDKALRAPNEISLGILDDILTQPNGELTADLEKNSANPVTWFKINGTEATTEQENLNVAGTPAVTTTFEFEQGANFSNSVSKYVERSGVDLLCVRKSKLMDFNKNVKSASKQIQKAIQKTDIPVLILES